MSHLPLDARAILEYLNELGYRNISAEQLKEFMKDLRKLIKYEERLGSNANQDDYFESLFRRTTASYRAKVDKENVSTVKLINDEGARGNTLRKSSNASVVTSAKENIPFGIQKSTQKTSMTSPTNVESKLSGTQQSTVKILSEGNRIQGKSGLKNKSGALSPHNNYISNKETTSTKRHGKNGTDEKTLESPNVELGKGARAKERIGRETQRSTRIGRDSQRSTSATGIIRKISKDFYTPHWERQSSPSWGRSSDRGTERTRASSGTIVPLPRKKTRADRSGINDPVKLYHWYQNEWKHFQKQIPTENTRADVRWQIRQKLLDPQ